MANNALLRCGLLCKQSQLQHSYLFSHFLQLPIYNKSWTHCRYRIFPMRKTSTASTHRWISRGRRTHAWPWWQWYRLSLCRVPAACIVCRGAGFGVAGWCNLLSIFYYALLCLGDCLLNAASNVFYILIVYLIVNIDDMQLFVLFVRFAALAACVDVTHIAVAGWCNQPLRCRLKRSLCTCIFIYFESFRVIWCRNLS